MGSELSLKLLNGRTRERNSMTSNKVYTQHAFGFVIQPKSPCTANILIKRIHIINIIVCVCVCVLFSVCSTTGIEFRTIFGLYIHCINKQTNIEICILVCVYVCKCYLESSYNFIRMYSSHSNEGKKENRNIHIVALQ